MVVEPIILQFGLGLVSSITLLVMTFVFRSINRQNVILTILTQQVGTLNFPLLDKRVLDLEADMARVWAWKEAQNQQLVK